MYPNDKKSKPIPPGTFVTTPLRSIDFGSSSDSKKSKTQETHPVEQKLPKSEKKLEEKKLKSEKKVPVSELRPEKPEKKPESSRSFSPILLLSTIILAIIAVVGAGFGFYEYTLLSKKEKETISVELEYPDGSREALSLKETIPGNAGSTIVVFAPEEEPPEPVEIVKTEEYIYVGEWNTKLKLPENIKYLRYSYIPLHDSGVLSSDNTSYVKTSSLCVSGASADLDAGTMPSFVEKSSGVCMIHNSGVPADKDNVAPQFRIEENDFFVQTPQIFSGTAGEKDWEARSNEILFDWLSDPDIRSYIEEPLEPETEEDNEEEIEEDVNEEIEESE